jgi:molybdopterin/thiamine biosynthesis adenylyltransferase
MLISTYCRGKCLNLYCSPNTVGVIKSGIKRWAGYVAYLEEEKRNAYRVLVGNIKERDHWKTWA